MVFAVPEALAETCSGSRKVPNLADLKWKWKVGQYRLVFTDGQIKSVAGMGETVSKLRNLTKRREPRGGLPAKKRISANYKGIGPAGIGQARGGPLGTVSQRKAPIKRSHKETVDEGAVPGKAAVRKASMR